MSNQYKLLEQDNVRQDDQEMAKELNTFLKKAGSALDTN